MITTHHPPCRDSFLGTAVSIPQHIRNDNPAVVRVLQEIPEDRAQPKSKSIIKSLPKSFTDVALVLLPNNVIPTVTDDQVIPISAEMDD